MMRSAPERLAGLARLIIEADSVASLREAAREAYQALGFDAFTFGHYDLENRRAVLSPCLTTLSPEMIVDYADLWRRVDPFLQAGIATGRPVPWRIGGFVPGAIDGDFLAFLERLPARSGLIIPLLNTGSLLGGVCLSSAEEKTIAQPIADAAFLLSTTAYLKLTLFEIDIDAEAEEAAARDGDVPGLLASAVPSPLEGLSDRQIEILKWMAAGKSNMDIATILDLSKRGVDYHVGVILGKLGVATRAQAIAVLSADRHASEA